VGESEGDSMKEQLRRIVEKLKSCRVQGLTCFGSESHGFSSHPISDLVGIERELRLKLPEDFREFLRLVGKGAGPYYGIYGPDGFATFYDMMEEGQVNLEAVQLNEGTNTEMGVINGAITIGTQGCSGFNLLLVSGLQAGRVVYADLEHPDVHLCSDACFLDWYERWLVRRWNLRSRRFRH